MKTISRRRGVLTASLGLFLAGLGGCQTYVPTTSQTLPSPWYLQHPPQFIPPSPQFPLPRELAHLEDAAAQPGPAAPPVVPVPVPAPGAVPPGVVPAPAPGVVPAPVPGAVPAPPPPGAVPAPGPQ
jgi:hypothetical protein